MRTLIAVCLLNFSACFVQDNPEYCSPENEAQVCTDKNKPCNYAHHRCEDVETIIRGGSPIIQSVMPARAKTGDLVTIAGQNFPSGMKVSVGGMLIDATTVSPTQLDFTMPPAAICSTVPITAQTASGDAITGQLQIKNLLSNVKFTTQPDPFSVGGTTSALVAGQLSVGDEALDLAVVTNTVPSLHRILGPTGSFSQQLASAIPYASVAVRDMDNDKSLEIIAGGASSIDVYYAPNYTTASGVPTTNSSAFALGDINKDGRLDIFSYENVAMTYRVGYALDMGAFVYAGFMPALSLSGPGQALLVDDLNGDGNLDIVAGTTNSGLQYSFGALSGFPVAQSLATGGGATNLLGILDSGAAQKILIVGTSSMSGGKLFRGIASGGAIVLNEITQLQAQAIGLLFEDMNCDGFTDIVVYYAMSRAVDIFLNNGNGGFKTNAAVADIFLHITSGAIYTKNPSDGRPDLAVVRTNGILDILINSSD